MGGFDWFIEKAQASARYQQALGSLKKDRYTVQEAADIADVHVKTLRKHIGEGKLTVTSPSDRKTWVHKEDLAAYLCRRNA